MKDGITPTEISLGLCRHVGELKVEENATDNSLPSKPPLFQQFPHKTKNLELWHQLNFSVPFDPKVS